MALTIKLGDLFYGLSAGKYGHYIEITNTSMWLANLHNINGKRCFGVKLQAIHDNGVTLQNFPGLGLMRPITEFELQLLQVCDV
jgi:hypothetical protein